MAASYGLNMDDILRQLRQKKATSGFVPKGFVNDILEANVGTYANRANAERGLALQETGLAQSKELAEKNLAASESQFARNLAASESQFARNLAERASEFGVSNERAKEQLDAQRTANIANLAVQAPLNIAMGTWAYDKLFPSDVAKKGVETLANKDLFGRPMTDEYYNAWANAIKANPPSPSTPSALPTSTLDKSISQWTTPSPELMPSTRIVPPAYDPNAAYTSVSGLHTGGSLYEPGVMGGVEMVTPTAGATAGLTDLATWAGPGSVPVETTAAPTIAPTLSDVGTGASIYGAIRGVGKLGEALDLPGGTLWSAMQEPATGVLKETGKFAGINELEKLAEYENKIVTEAIEKPFMEYVWNPISSFFGGFGW